MPPFPWRDTRDLSFLLYFQNVESIPVDHFLTAVGGIMVHYATCLQGQVLASGAFTLIVGPECNHWNAFLFRFPETHFPKVVRIATKLYHKIELIQAISMVLFPPSCLFWKARYGSCRVFVYLLYPDGADDSEHALYIVGKIISMGVQRN